MKGKLIVFFLLICLVALGATILATEKPTGAVLGRVTTKEGLPLKNARVIFSGPGRKTVFTNDDGYYRADRLVIGRYVVQARQKGFDSQWITPSILVKEGEVLKGVSFALMPREPSFYFANYQRVFTPQEPLRIGVRGTLVDRIELTLYRLDLEKLLLAGRRDALDGIDHTLPEGFPKGALSEEKSFSQKILSSDEDDWFYQAIAPDLGKNTGTYLLVMKGYEAGSNKMIKADSTWFNRTDLALVAKRSSNRLLLYAVNLQTKKTEKEVDFTVFGRNGRVMSGKTGKDGLFLAPFRGEERVAVLGKKNQSFASLSSYHYEDNRQTRMYSYTDRPVYRPAQTVFLRGIAKSVKSRAFLQNFPVRLRVKDPSDAVLYDKFLTTDSFGAYRDSLTLPEEAVIGEYSIEAIFGKSSDYAHFKVQEYRKPEYRLEVKTDKSFYLSGETIKAAVAANYYFGSPVTGSKVNYTVYSTPIYGNSEDKKGTDADLSNLYFDFIDSEGTSWGYGDVVTQGEAVTDSNGQITLSIPTRRIEAAQPFEQTHDQRYTLEVEAVDSSRRPVKAKGSTLVARALVNLSAVLEEGVIAPNQPVRLLVHATDREGRPLSDKKIKISAFEEREIPGEGETKISFFPLFDKEGKTKQGRLFEELKFPKEGQYDIAVSTIDAAGNTVSEQVWLWVASGENSGYESSYRYGSMRFFFDKKVYRPGEKAKVILSAPLGNVPVLLTREGSTIEDARVIQLNSPNKLLEIPITREMEPNIFLGAALVNGKEFHSVEKSLNVSPEENFLKVEIEPGREKYAPGEKAKISLRISDAKGRPVEAECSLGVVDEAVYAIEPDQTPDIRRFFLGPRYSSVSTSYSFPEEYSGGLSKESEEPRVRQKFEDTALWLPNLQTDRKGSAEISFTLPDNLTTWVVTVRANSISGKVGSSTSTFLVSKDLLVRLINPRFLTQGDSLTLAAIIHNRTKKGEDLAIDLKAENLRVLPPKKISLSVPAEGSKRTEWRTEAPKAGEANLILSARGKRSGDALKSSFPVLPHGIERIENRTGILVPGQSVLTFEVPKNSENIRLQVDFNPTPLSAILAALDYLSQYPYGCTEQTTSRFLPELTTIGTLRKLGIERTLDEKQVRKALKRLYGYQQSDGGWAWWENGDSEPELTSYVLLGLDAARWAGFEVERGAVGRGLSYLREFIRKAQPDVARRHTIERGSGYDAAAFSLYALSRYGPVPEKQLATLFDKAKNLSNTGKALLSLALTGSGRPDRAESLLSDGKSISSPGLNHWLSAAVPYSWFDGDVEATAWSLQAILALHPRDARVLPTVRWLMAQKSGAAWESTKETAAVILALDSALLASPPAPQENKIIASLDGKKVFGEKERLTDLVSLHPGSNFLAIESEKSLPYCAQLRFFEKKERLEATSSKNLSLSRHYYFLPREAWAKSRELQGEAFPFKDLALVDRSVRSGDLVLVRLTIKNSEALRYLVVEDPLPGGAEVLEETEESWGYWWNHREVRDEKVALFVSRLDAGTHDLFYVMRPELPGVYSALPASVFPMYAPELRASTSEKRLEIKP